MSITKLSTARRINAANVGGSLDPRTISGLAAWWDASVAGSFFQNSNGTTSATATGDPIGYWADLSGNGKHMTQTTSNLRPAVLVNGLNGKPCVNVPTTSNAGFSAISAPTTSTAATVLIAAQYRSTVYRMHFLSADAGSFMDATDVNAFSPASGAGSPTYRVNGVAVASTRLALYNATQLFSTYVLAITGVNVSGWSSGWRAFNYGSSYQFAGYVGECLVYSSLTTDARTALEAYLRAKWGSA